jgi:hypothetical protein
LKLWILFLQPHGEVDPSFYDEFKKELDADWRFVTTKFVHVVKFNQDRVFPLLNEGWPELKSRYDFIDMEEITIAYYGHHNFGVISHKPLLDIKQVPLFHSRALKIGYTMNFCVNLTPENMNKPYLVRCLLSI